MRLVIPFTPHAMSHKLNFHSQKSPNGPRRVILLRMRPNDAEIRNDPNYLSKREVMLLHSIFHYDQYIT